MKIRHLIGIAVAGILAPLAQAGLIQLTLSGNIENSSEAPVASGQTFTLSMIYETSGSPQFISQSQGFYINHFTSLNFSTAGYSAFYTGAFGQINKYNNLGVLNQDGISFQFAANQATYQYTNPKPNTVALPNIFSTVSQPFDNIIVNLASFSHDLWEDYSLPTTYNLADFGQNHSIQVAFSNGGFGGTGITLQVSDPAQTPEPSTAALIIAAGGCLVALRRRRSA